MSSGNDELSNSKHGSVAKALVGDRSLGGGDKFDALVQGARSSSGAQDEPTDRFDAMVRGVRSSGGDELSNSKHGSVAKALVVDREVRLLGNDDLGSSKHGNVTKDLVIERLDALVCTFYPKRSRTAHMFWNHNNMRIICWLIFTLNVSYHSYYSNANL